MLNLTVRNHHNLWHQKFGSFAEQVIKVRFVQDPIHLGINIAYSISNIANGKIFSRNFLYTYI